MRVDAAEPESIIQGMFDRISIINWHPISRTPPITCRDELGECSAEILLAPGNGRVLVGRYYANHETFIVAGLAIDWVKYWASFPVAPADATSIPQEFQSGPVVIDHST